MAEWLNEQQHMKLLVYISLLTAQGHASTSDTSAGVRLRQETEEDRRAIGSQNFIAR